MRIDPDRLIRLAILIQHGSFRRAAEHLGLTQPALSQSIAQIEKEVGVKLIDRTPHGIEPTIYGQVLYEHARAIDHELVQAAQKIQELAFGHRGSLAIGVTAGGAATMVALAICKLQATRPGLDTKIIEHSRVKTLLAQLHDRSLDMLICQRPRETDLKGARTYSLFQGRRMACVRADHPLKGQISLEDLSNYPFVCPQEEMGLLFGFRQIFSAAGLVIPEVMVSNSISVAKEIVLNSDAFALFSNLSVMREQKSGEVRMIDLASSESYWMQLIFRAEQTPTEIMADLVTSMVKLCAELGIEAHPDTRGLVRRPRAPSSTRFN